MNTGRSPLSSLRLVLIGLALLPLTGCSLLADASRESSTIYAPSPDIRSEADWPAANWQLSLPQPSAARMIDSLRITVRPSPNELQVYKDAQWAKPPSDMLADALLRGFEDSGKLPAVARQGSGIGADYRLLLELRRFESDYGQGQAVPSAVIEVNAKLLHARDQRVVASRNFLQAQPAASTAVADVVEAFRVSLGDVTHDLVGWTLTAGAARERDHRSR